ncbi:MAG: hypothetical protein U1E17_04925 [Geminicoccaceae bacterium]
MVSTWVAATPCGRGIGDEARADRREHGVRDRERSEQEQAAACVLAPAIVPDREDALKIGLRQAQEAPGQAEARGEVQRQEGAQCREAAVHLGAHRAGDGARAQVGRPARIVLGQELADGEAVPDAHIAHDQRRPPCRWASRPDHLGRLRPLRISSSSNGTPICLSSSQGRSDQEELFLLPMTSLRVCMGMPGNRGELAGGGCNREDGACCPCQPHVSAN